jgi:NADH dehydrogenase [ubiquinone] 1 alpha subcomplex assembly factor 6
LESALPAVTSTPAAGSALWPIAALVRRHDRDRYQTALFAPAARRDALFALYAFNYEIARVRERVSEPMLGRIRLQWWREVVAEAYADGPARRHQIAAAVTAAIRGHGLSRRHFERLIDTRERDLEEGPPATLAALEEYAEGSSAPLLLLALELLGAGDEPAIAAAREVGIGYALAGLSRAAPLLARQQKLMIPADIAARHGLDARDYLELRATPQLRAATAEVAAAALGHLRAARTRHRQIPRRALPALLPAVVAERTLARLAQAGYNPFAPVLAAPDALQSWRLAIAWLRRRF